MICECVNVKCSCSAPLSDKMSAARRELSCFVRSLSGAHPDIQLRNGEEAGLEKTRVFLKNPAQCFFWFFLGYFVFFVFLGFLGFLNIFAQKREFLGFFSFKNTFRCIQTLNYNHSY
jgi:hypothetical protein